MGYRSAADGMITITPPLTWAEISDSPYLPYIADTDVGDYRNCQYATLTVHDDTDAGQISTISAVAVEPVEPGGSRKRYDLAEHIQKIINRHPDHEFAGIIDCLGEDGDRWRLTVVDRTVVERRPTLVWPSETSSGEDHLRRRIAEFANALDEDGNADHVKGCEGEPTCVTCVAEDLRRILGS